MQATSFEPDAPPLLTRWARTIFLAGAEALSVGLGAWLVASRSYLLEYFQGNAIDPGRRRLVFLSMGLALAFAGAAAAFVTRWRGFDTLERLVRRLSPLALAWLVPFLFARSLWEGRALVVLPVVVGAGWGLVAAARTCWTTEPAFPELAAWFADRAKGARRGASLVAALLRRDGAPLVVVIASAVAYGVYFSLFTITSHANLGTHGFDLALEDNLMWHVLRPSDPLFRSAPFSGPTGTHFGNHATWFSFVLAPMYAVFPGPEVLLVLQAFLLGAAAIPLYLYAKRHVPAWNAALVALAYLLYPPLHGANLYDFHYLPLGVFFLWLTLYAIESGHRRLAVIAVVLALSVREDVAACLGVLGLVLLLSPGSARVARDGARLAVIGGGYFLLMKLFVMPRLGHADASFIHQYRDLVPPGEAGFGSVLETIVGNPAYTLNVVIERDKIGYVLEILAPLLFLPVTRPIGLLLVVPGVVFTLLSTGYRPLYQTSFQYTSYWTTFAFMGVVGALAHAGKPLHAGDERGIVRRRSTALGLAFASLACTYLFGAVFHRTDAPAGFGRASFETTAADLENRASLAALVRQIPTDARVAASDRLLPHVSTRDGAYTLAQSVYDADWLLFEPTLLAPGERRVVREALGDDTFGVVEQRGTMVLAKRGADAAGNAAVLSSTSR